MLWIIFVLGLLAMSVDMFPYRTLMTEKEKTQFKKELAEKHSSKVSPSVAAYIAELREFEATQETPAAKSQTTKEKSFKAGKTPAAEMKPEKTDEKEVVAKEVELDTGKVVKLPVKEHWEREYEQMMMAIDEQKNQYSPEPIAASDDLDEIDALIEEQLSFGELDELDSED